MNTIRAPASTSFSHRVVTKLDRPVAAPTSPTASPVTHDRTAQDARSVGWESRKPPSIEDSVKAVTVTVHRQERLLRFGTGHHPMVDRYLGAQFVSGLAPHQAGVTHHVHRLPGVAPEG